MNTHFQLILNSASVLPIHEQKQLVKMLSNQLNTKEKNNQFWQTPSLFEIEQLQGKKHYKNLSNYQADFLPDTETTDDWLNYFEKQHQQHIEY